MAKKVYAVRHGYSTGLFYTWEETQKSISGFSGAEYRGFKSESEAQAYLEGKEIGVFSGEFVEIPKITDDYTANLYTDGSYKDGSVAFGICIETNKVTRKFYGVVSCREYASINNIAGELLSVLIGVQMCRCMGLTKVNIIYDYKGVELYINNEWKSKGKLQNIYVALMNQFNSTFRMHFNFIHVKSHSGVYGNVTADKMAARGRNLQTYVDLDKILRGALDVSDVPCFLG